MNELGVIAPIEGLEKAAKWAAPLVIGPVALIPQQWEYFYKPAIEYAAKNMTAPEEQKQSWAPQPQSEDHTLLWVLGAVAVTGIAIAIFRR